jgi:uncharacterized oligopeptide transporter (OPT) family protein
MIPPTDTFATPLTSESPSPPAPRTAAEFTWRAAITGCVIGAVLAAGNVYTGLKTAYVDGGSITAAVLAFALLGRTSRNKNRPYSMAENNLTQTISSSAAVMSVVTGLTGPVAALSLGGHTYPFWVIAIWGMAVGAIGISIARSLRQRLVLTEELPFPSGRATGEVIESMHTRGASDHGRARLLLTAGAVAALVTWFRDAKPTFVPQALTLPWGNAALTAGSLWLGTAVSPVMLAAGALIGPRGGVSVLLGSVTAWGILAPAILAMRWVVNAEYGAVSGWLLWPGVALLVSSAFTSLCLEWRSVLGAGRDLANLGRGSASAEDAAPRRLWAVITVVSVVAAAAIGWTCFDVHPIVVCAAIAFALVMAGVCARAAGETDLAPVGSAGALGQILFGAPSVVTSIVCGSTVFGAASQTAQTMWAFKAGHRLKTDPHVQSLGQLLGLVVGALVVVPVYELIVSAYGLGTPVMPAPSAMSWKATADAVQLGTTAMPAGAGLATAIAFAVGIALTLMGRTSVAKFLPSAIPLGIAFLIPAPLGGAIFLGGMAFGVLRYLRPQWTGHYVPSLAAGAIAGESLMGIVIAALLAAGLLGGV